MLKFITPYRGYNFLRHTVVKVKSAQLFPTLFASTSEARFQIRSYTSGKNTNDTCLHNFYEYPDVSNEDVEQPYTNWEGAENRHAHSILEKRELYHSTIVQPPVQEELSLSEFEIKELLCKNWRFTSVSELVKAFRLISHYANKNGENVHASQYENILNSLTTNSKIFSDDQIFHVLQSLMLWLVEMDIMESSYAQLYSALDDECKKRARTWSTQQLLFVSDHWYRLRLTKKSQFVMHAIMNLGNQIATLSTPNLVQLMFYVSVSRNSLINYRDAEFYLNSAVEHLDIDEIAIVALGFFKSQQMIRDRRLLTKIVNETIREIESINEITLAAILKVVRYSIHINDLEFLCKLLENTIPQIPRLSVTCLVHVILAAANKSLFFADLLNAVTRRFYREISKLRMKDIRSLVFALSSFNYVPETQPNILDRIVLELNEANRQNELKRFPHCFANCLHCLSILNRHPKNLIAQVLAPESIKNMYGSNVHEIQRDILALDLDIEAEIPDYRGPRLDVKIRENVATRLTDWAPWVRNSQFTAADYFMLDVVRACQEYLGSRDLVHVDHVLPQYQRPDVIICLDKSNSPIPIVSIMSKLPFGSVKHPPQIYLDDVRWVVLIIGSNNSYAKNANRLLGHICAKHRQLEGIGYKPFVIFCQDWKQLRNDREKFKYLQCKVFH